MKKLLLIIDLQNDFINENTKHLPNEITQLLGENKYNNIIFTKFINTKSGIWYKKLNYTGCITESGKQIAINVNNYTVIEKTTYSSLTDEVKSYIIKNNIDEIDLCGIDTECCVLKTALDLFENNYNVKVLKNYCACTHGMKRHNNALNIMIRCIGKDNII